MSLKEMKQIKIKDVKKDNMTLEDMMDIYNELGISFSFTNRKSNSIKIGFEKPNNSL